MLSVLPLPVENLGKVFENSRAGENPRRNWSALEFFQTFASVFTRLWYEGTENMFYFLNGKLKVSCERSRNDFNTKLIPSASYDKHDWLKLRTTKNWLNI